MSVKTIAAIGIALALLAPVGARAQSSHMAGESFSEWERANQRDQQYQETARRQQELQEQLDNQRWLSQAQQPSYVPYSRQLMPGITPRY